MPRFSSHWTMAPLNMVTSSCNSPVLGMVDTRVGPRDRRRLFQSGTTSLLDTGREPSPSLLSWPLGPGPAHPARGSKWPLFCGGGRRQAVFPEAQGLWLHPSLSISRALQPAPHRGPHVRSHRAWWGTRAYPGLFRARPLLHPVGASLASHLCGDQPAAPLGRADTHTQP